MLPLEQKIKETNMKIFLMLLFYLLFINLLLSQNHTKKLYPPYSKNDLEIIIDDIELGIGYLILIKSKKEKRSYHLINTQWFTPMLNNKLDKVKIKKMLIKGIFENGESYLTISESNIKLFNRWSDCKLIEFIFGEEGLIEKNLNYFESKPVILAALIKRNIEIYVSDFSGDLMLSKNYKDCWK